MCVYCVWCLAMVLRILNVRINDIRSLESFFVYGKRHNYFQLTDTRSYSNNLALAHSLTQLQSVQCTHNTWRACNRAYSGNQLKCCCLFYDMNAMLTVIRTPSLPADRPPLSLHLPLLSDRCVRRATNIWVEMQIEEFSCNGIAVDIVKNDGHNEWLMSI